MKPLIGVTCGLTNRNENKGRYDLNMLNIMAITRAGGTPFILPYDDSSIDEYLETLDGIFFTGGVDFSPWILGEEPSQNIGEICTARDTFEMNLCQRAYDKKIPMLGICRGMQLINVSLGGTLYQDIYSTMPKVMMHKQTKNGTPLCEYFHKVKINKGSIVSKIFETDSLYTNTSHHQSVRGVPEHFEVVAHTSDNIVEAIEYKNSDNFIVGVQWHPEFMINVHPESMKIFNYFIQECINRKNALTE